MPCSTEAIQFTADRVGKARIIAEAAPLEGVPGKTDRAEQAADDPQLQLALARKLAEHGTQRLTEKQPAQAQADLEKARTVFTRLLAKYPMPQWTVLKPTNTEGISKGGATLKLLEDGSILASGTNPPKDEYTVVARPDLEHITAIRLEALPDPSLPRNGPGRNAAGSFDLNKLRVFSAGQPCPLTNIVVEQPNLGNKVPLPLQSVIEGAVDTSIGWSNYLVPGQSSTAIVTARVERALKDDLKIEMVFATAPGRQLHNLGRFRLAVTGTPDALKSAEFRQDLKDSEVTDLTVALATAHAQQGHTDEAVALFMEALDQAGDSAAKAWIIALAAPLEGVLYKLAERAPDDGSLQAALARQLAAHGNAPLAGAAWAKARALFERQTGSQVRQRSAGRRRSGSTALG